MATKHYDWTSGVPLQEHSEKKLNILRDYFRRYLFVRCQYPSSNLKLAVVDGFAGAGKYNCNTLGSPLIFLDVLGQALEEINIERKTKNLPLVNITLTAFYNDKDGTAIDMLKENVAPYNIKINENPRITLNVNYSKVSFESFYYNQKKLLTGYRNIIFNLDQYGYSDVSSNILNDIIKSWDSVEIFLTFAIQALLTYLPRDKTKIDLSRHPEIGNLIRNELKDFSITTKERLGMAQNLVFEYLKSVANFVSPFAIHNKDGWEYWLIHIATNYRAREEYNNILHKNASHQAHFGAAGLNMLGHKNENENQLYLFNEDSKQQSLKELYDDIPRYISSNDSMPMQDFYNGIYNNTPASKEIIDKAIMLNPDLEIVTEKNKLRRSEKTIKRKDNIRLKPQKSFSFLSSIKPN